VSKCEKFDPRAAAKPVPKPDVAGPLRSDADGPSVGSGIGVRRGGHGRYILITGERPRTVGDDVELTARRVDRYGGNILRTFVA